MEGATGCDAEEGEEMSVETVTLAFYKLLEGGEAFIKPDAKVWRPPEDVKIVGFQGSISSFPLVHAQAWLVLNPEGLKQEQVIFEDPTHGIFGHLNSGCQGAANIAVIFPPERFILLREGVPLYLAIWGHNMQSILGWKQKGDFHVQYDVYFEVAE